jgi:hypothetical protein
MRKPTKEEAERWLTLAREHGFTNADGTSFQLGRFSVEPLEQGAIQITFITPVPAGLRTEHDLRLKTPPILFDRTENGELLLPGRWWASTFEALSEQSGVPTDVRQKALMASRYCAISDGVLPAETETIEILAPDEEGHLVPHEALVPGTSCLIRLNAK